jgi:hypothetical protein
MSGTSFPRTMFSSRQLPSLVDKVGDEDDLRAPEVVAGPKEDPSGEEKVV